MIEQITLQGVNTKFAGNIKINSSAFSEKNDLNSHGGLLKEYSKLQIQLKQLSILEKRMRKQLEGKNVFCLKIFPSVVLRRFFA